MALLYSCIFIAFFIADQHHFDNPVYAYQPVSKSQPNLNEKDSVNSSSSSGGLNTIHNNLHHNHHKDTNNRHWDKLGNFTFDEDATSSVGEHGRLFITSVEAR